MAGLDIAADDDLPKPFERRAAVARLQSVLPRSREARGLRATPERLRAEDLTVDLRRRTATLRGDPLPLTTMEFELLALFVKNPGAVLSRDEIMDCTPGIDWEAYSRSIDVAMSRLRHKLNDDPKQPRYFKTIWGTGYLFLPTPLPVNER